MDGPKVSFLPAGSVMHQQSPGVLLANTGNISLAGKHWELDFQPFALKTGSGSGQDCNDQV